jgi:tetratricopeptide (TPR) repeat protein
LTEDKSILIKTAYAYYQKGDWDRAIEEYHKLADLDSGDLNVLNILADIYAKKGDLQEALRQYDLVAQGYDQKNQVDKVLQVYKRMLKLVPNNQELMGAVKNLVTKYLDRASQMEEAEPQKASEIYRSILRADPNRYDASVRFAKLLMRSGEKYQAIENLMVLSDALDPATQTGRLAEVLQLVTEWDPLNIESHERLASLLVGAKQPTEAVNHYRALVEIFISKNDHAKAEECAHKAIDLGDTETYYHLGVIHFNQEHYAEARNAFVTFLAKHDAHVGALKYLALSNLRLNQHKEAVDTSARIMQVYVNENLLDEAHEVRHTILELDPSNEAALKLAPSEPSRAEAAAEPIAPTAEPPVPAAPAGPETISLDAGLEQDRLMGEAESFVEKGLYDQAVDRYLEMLKRWPDHAEARNLLQKTYVLMARAVEPEQKGPTPEEMRAELERELREQMKRELDEQARRLSEEQVRLAAERQEAIEQIRREQEKERIRLQQEMEGKLLEEIRRSKREEELRQQLQKELEEKQKALEEQQEKLETEKMDAFNQMKEDLERSKAELEQKVREHVERELQERAERDAREKEKQAEREAKVQELMRREAEEKRRFEEEKQQQATAQARINREIVDGLERLRREKEVESTLRPTPPAPPPKPIPAPSVPALDLSIETQAEAELGASAQARPSAPAASGGEGDSLEDPFVRQTLADIYAKQGLFVEAVKIYEKILNDEPENEEVRNKLRNVLKMKGL